MHSQTQLRNARNNAPTTYPIRRTRRRWWGTPPHDGAGPRGSRRSATSGQRSVGSSRRPASAPCCYCHDRGQRSRPRSVARSRWHRSEHRSGAIRGNTTGPTMRNSRRHRVEPSTTNHHHRQRNLQTRECRNEHVRDTRLPEKCTEQQNRIKNKREQTNAIHHEASRRGTTTGNRDRREL